MIDRSNDVYDHDGWLMYQQEQWESKHNWLAFTLGTDTPFTRSNGTLMAKIYERLTKASRRRVPRHPGGEVAHWPTAEYEEMYRQGVYDAYKALQEELS